MVGGLAFVLGALTALGAWLGHYLDRRWGTVPWLTLAGTLLGMGAGFFEVASVLRHIGRDG
jgi:F0F1-type ATP synthase assembly protein I